MILGACVEENTIIGMGGLWNWILLIGSGFGTSNSGRIGVESNPWDSFGSACGMCVCVCVHVYWWDELY